MRSSRLMKVHIRSLLGCGSAKTTGETLVPFLPPAAHWGPLGWATKYSQPFVATFPGTALT